MSVPTSELSHWPPSLCPGPDTVGSERSDALMSAAADGTEGAESGSGFGFGLRWPDCPDRPHQLDAAAHWKHKNSIDKYN